MNELMKRVAEQAEVEFYEGDDGVPYMCGTQDALREFAETIVRECTKIVADAVDHCEPASTYTNKIKLHFGVKE